MRAVVQRVQRANVSVDGLSVAAIGPGLLVLCGVSPSDTDADRDWLARKIVSLRVFDDDAGIMNRSLRDVGGELLAVSQFTLRVDAQRSSAFLQRRRASGGRRARIRGILESAGARAGQASAHRGFWRTHGSHAQ